MLAQYAPPNHPARTRTREENHLQTAKKDEATQSLEMTEPLQEVGARQVPEVSMPRRWRAPAPLIGRVRGLRTLSEVKRRYEKAESDGKIQMPFRRRLLCGLAFQLPRFIGPGTAFENADLWRVGEQ